MQYVSAPKTARIGFVTGSVGLGGATNFLCNLGGELIRRKIPAAVLSFQKDNPMAPDFERMNIPVLCFDERRAIFEDRLKAVLTGLSRFNPSVVLATLDASSFEVLRYLPAGVFRVGVGQSDHVSTYETLRCYAPHMDLLAVVSETMKRKVEALPEISRVRVACLPYGVPLPASGQMQERDLNRPLRIIYLGRLVENQKRVRLFPVILDRLKSSGIPFHWTLAGDGPEKEFLERTMKGSETQTVSFPGNIPYAGVPRVLSKHDVFLLASDHEGLPLSLLEAMGHGLVPVVSNVESGIPEVVDESTGRLVALNNVAGYADAIVWLHQHRDEMKLLSQNAREKVQRKFSVEAMTDRWLAAFPQNPSPIGAWPADWKIKPMLAARHPIYFSPPIRALRRLAAKLRK